jgi:hypothetical protein
MTKRVNLTTAAVRALVPICHHIAEWPMDPANWPLWRDALREVLAEIDTPTDAAAALVYAAETVAYAADVVARDGAMARLRFELRGYTAHVAAAQLAALRALRAETRGQAA